jgi:hypothetical protein
MLTNGDQYRKQGFQYESARPRSQRRFSQLIPMSIMWLGILAFAPNAGMRSYADTPSTACDPALWFHTYHGNFATAKDRLKVIEPCKTVTGTLHFVGYEPDGDTHLRLDVDPQFKDLLNGKNADEGNMLVVESMCDKKPSQRDTVAEGVCTNWHQHIYKSDMNNKHVSVTGAYVEDVERGWREIHPVTSITVIQ